MVQCKEKKCDDAMALCLLQVARGNCSNNSSRTHIDSGRDLAGIPRTMYTKVYGDGGQPWRSIEYRKKKKPRSKGSQTNKQKSKNPNVTESQNLSV